MFLPSFSESFNGLISWLWAAPVADDCVGSGVFICGRDSQQQLSSLGVFNQNASTVGVRAEDWSVVIDVCDTDPHCGDVLQKINSTVQTKSTFACISVDVSN